MDKKYIIGIVCIVLIAIVAIAASMSGGDNTATTKDADQNDPFNGANAKLENITISSNYGSFDVSGKIMFKNDETYADLGANVNLQDGSKISESIVKNWNDVEKNQWYALDGYLLSASGNDYSLSDIKSIDFKYDGKIVYTWENK
ncbi:hypothetical protein [Methanobrevibacter filiformis]|uniref:Uncharacterized protein n=1 Tax=Methanobrevibacter filiformis TaxID=55758 RepID=A0A166DFD5_9EURY|nr:hypothetical protein [Methanobrevibacter filiformis]KZX15542.1 hypothetical protein MBFIL_06340 [Methanobrevibacter filiformis]